MALNTQLQATTENFTNLIKNFSTIPLQSVCSYNNKLLEFALANGKAAYECAQKLSTTRSASEFIELITKQTHEQSEVLARQSKELIALVEKAMPKSSDFKGLGT